MTNWTKKLFKPSTPQQVILCAARPLEIELSPIVESAAPNTKSYILDYEILKSNWNFDVSLEQALADNYGATVLDRSHGRRGEDWLISIPPASVAKLENDKRELMQAHRGEISLV